MMSLVIKSLLLIIALQDVTTVLAKSTKAPITVDNTQPLYEAQLAIWPTDLDDIIEAVMEPSDQGTIHPLIEQPIAVMPDMDYLQDDEILNDEDIMADDYNDHEILYDPNVDIWPSILEQKPGYPVQPDPIIVLQNYYKTFANGSVEYKLVLSNGMVNFQHIDHVRNHKGVVSPVQYGYYTVPIQGKKMTYQTIYYRADKKGYVVTKMEISNRNPAYDFYLQYSKDQDLKYSKNKDSEI